LVIYYILMNNFITIIVIIKIFNNKKYNFFKNKNLTKHKTLHKLKHEPKLIPFFIFLRSWCIIRLF
jgi:hypothetical protein